MATSRRELAAQPNARISRIARNTQKSGAESHQQGLLRRARSVPSSPDRLRPSASTPAAAGAPTSAGSASRPSSSFNPRTAASSSSRKSATATLLHSVSDVVGAKQPAGAIRRRAAAADKSGASAGAATTTTSVWPHAVAAATSTKDPASGRAAAAAKSSPSSNAQKSTKFSTRPGGAEKTAASPKPRTTKATTTTIGAGGKTQAASPSSSTTSLARGAGAASAKRRATTGSDTTAAPSPIQRTTSVPAATPEEASGKQDVELLMGEFDELESISTPSIEEHLQQRLPDPVDVTTYAASSADKNCQQEAGIAEHLVSEEKRQDLDADAGTDAGAAAAVVEGAVGENELKEAESKDTVDDTELNEVAGETELTKGAVDETQLTSEAGSGTELLKDTEPVAVKEEAEADEAERIVLPATTKAPEAVAQRLRKDDHGNSNEAATTEESRSKATTMQERRNKVMALVGRFETAMSARE